MSAARELPFEPAVCRCGNTATRYLPGKRRTFYCGIHGPTAVRDWGRLISLPNAPAPVGTALAASPPLPAPVAALIDRFVDGLRDVIAHDLPSTSTADPETLTALQRENTQLRAQLERVTVELRNAEDVAYEAMALWPEPGIEAPAAKAKGTEPKPLTERDFPLPDTEPKPRTKEDDFNIAPLPEPVDRPQPARPPSKGFRIHPQEPQETNKPPTVTPPPIITEVSKGSVIRDMVDLFSLDAIVGQMVPGPRSPALSLTKRVVKDFSRLITEDKVRVVEMFQLLATQPEAVRVTPHGIEEFSARAGRRKRVVFEKGAIHDRALLTILRIVDRHDKTEFTGER